MLTVTPDKIATHATNVLLVALAMLVALGLALIIAPLFVKDKLSYERKVYNYALTFGNYGYLGDPVVLALFGLEGYDLIFYGGFKLSYMFSTTHTYWGNHLFPHNAISLLTLLVTIARIVGSNFL
jgi:predicted permease